MMRFGAGFAFFSTILRYVMYISKTCWEANQGLVEQLSRLDANDIRQMLTLAIFCKEVIISSREACTSIVAMYLAASVSTLPTTAVKDGRSREPGAG